MAHHKQRRITRSLKKKMDGIVKLKSVLERLMHKSMLSTQEPSYQKHHDDDEEAGRDDVPGDVKEGHFAVIASHEYEPRQRFVVPLMFLEHHRFLKLLEQAAEEYGFDHDGLSWCLADQASSG